MMLKDQNTKERIMEIAEHLIMSRGYNGFSYKDISSELKVKNAAIHYHYPSKMDLGIAVIRSARSRFRQWRMMITNQEVSPLDMLNQYFETYITYLKSEEYVCLGGSLETDFHTFPEDMQIEIRQYVSELIQWMETLLASGRKKEIFSFSGSPKDKAIFILSSVKGALQTARVSSKDSFFQVLNTVKNDLGLS
jgi:AcrR family transcriptional regulator